jgi:pyoverdine/dityrosine biosynthesis protein Dit1
MVIGHTQMSLEELAKKIGATNINDVLRFLDGKDFAENAQNKIRDQVIFGGNSAGKSAKLGIVKVACGTFCRR